ncbi:MAG: hypothetical protein WC856_24390 [Methylococcaceae bacterium]|jgi:hypothetical protein
MQKIFDLIYSNYEWLFSGLGVFILGVFFTKRASSTNNTKQQNITAGGDVVGRDKNTKK